MKLHLPIMVAGIACVSHTLYADTNDLAVKIYDLNPNQDATYDGALWVASAAKLTIEEASKTSIDFDNFSIKFTTTLNAAHQYGANLTSLRFEGEWGGTTADFGLFFYSGKIGYVINAPGDPDGPPEVDNFIYDPEKIIGKPITYAVVISGDNINAYWQTEDNGYALLASSVWSGKGNPNDGAQIWFNGINPKIDDKLDLTYSNIGIYNGDATKGIAPDNNDNIPEPATATLGLMALAGLVTRRRRK